MNTKENILKAWITIEQLSEGSIKKKDESLLSIDAKVGKLKKFLGDFLINQKEQNNISDASFKRAGIVLYFGIFNFEEVIENEYRCPSDDFVRYLINKANVCEGRITNNIVEKTVWTYKIGIHIKSYFAIFIT